MCVCLHVCLPISQVFFRVPQWFSEHVVVCFGYKSLFNYVISAVHVVLRFCKSHSFNLLFISLFFTFGDVYVDEQNRATLNSSSSRSLMLTERGWNAGMCIRTTSIDQVENRTGFVGMARRNHINSLSGGGCEFFIASLRTPKSFLPSLMISWPYLRYWGWAQRTLGPHLFPHTSISRKNDHQQAVCDIDGQCDPGAGGETASDVQGYSVRKGNLLMTQLQLCYIIKHCIKK